MPTSTTSDTALRPAAVLAAVIGALAYWLIADPLAGIDLRVTMNDEPTVAMTKQRLGD